MAKYEGDGSYAKLLSNTYGKVENGNVEQNYSEYSFYTQNDAMIVKFPINITRAGRFESQSGNFISSSISYFWENTSASKEVSFLLSSSVTRFIVKTTSSKTHGFSVRCVIK